MESGIYPFTGVLLPETLTTAGVTNNPIVSNPPLWMSWASRQS